MLAAISRFCYVREAVQDEQGGVRKAEGLETKEAEAGARAMVRLQATGTSGAQVCPLAAAGFVR